MALDSDARADRLRALLRRPGRVLPARVQSWSAARPRALRKPAQAVPEDEAPGRLRAVLIYGAAGLLSATPIVGLALLGSHWNATRAPSIGRTVERPAAPAPRPAPPPVASADAVAPPPPTPSPGPFAEAQDRGGARHRHADAGERRSRSDATVHHRRPAGSAATRRLNLRELHRIERRRHDARHRHRRR